MDTFMTALYSDKSLTVKHETDSGALTFSRIRYEFLHAQPTRRPT